MNAKAVEELLLAALDVFRFFIRLAKIDFFREHSGLLSFLFCIACFFLFARGVRCLNGNAPPAVDKDGDPALRQVFEERGTIIQEVYLSADGNPTEHKDGYSEFRREYDARGSIIRWYDERGNVIRWRYFDFHGDPTMQKDGYAEVRQEYDEYGNVIRSCYFDINSKPTSHPPHVG